MKLLQFENYELKVAPEALLIRPIRRLWNQDRSERKEKFYQQMSYLFFMVSPQSTYSYIMDLKERSKAIIEQEGLPKDFKPSELLEEAMRIYKQHTVTVSQEFLDAAMTAAKTVITKLKDPNLLNETDDKGKPINTIKTVTSSLKDAEGVLSTLQALKKKVDQELEDKGKTRGAQELTIGDMGM